nr:hypothetical protein OHB51_17415 [Micromonospora sp. NBC_00855]
MKRLVVDTHASSCYFRTSVGGDGRKALVQITERCNLHCAHCFVSSTAAGSDLSRLAFNTRVLPWPLDARPSSPPPPTPSPSYPPATAHTSSSVGTTTSSAATTNPYPGFRPLEYEFLDALTTLGLSDVHRTLHPEVQAHSWIGRRDQPLRVVDAVLDFNLLIIVGRLAGHEQDAYERCRSRDLRATRGDVGTLSERCWKKAAE